MGYEQIRPIEKVDSNGNDVFCTQNYIENCINTALKYKVICEKIEKIGSKKFG